MAEDLSKQVKIRIATYDRLTERGKKNETYDDIINRAIDAEDRLFVGRGQSQSQKGDKGKGRKGKGDNPVSDD